MPARPNSLTYQRRQPELTALYQLIQAHWPEAQRLCREASDGIGLPKFIDRAFERYLGCGRLENGLVRLHCPTCRQSAAVAFSCKTRGLCPSCDGRRMTEVSAHLVDEVIPAVPVRQWVLSLPYDLRYLLAWHRELRSAVLGAFMRAIEAHYCKQAKRSGLQVPKTGAISVVQRWNSAIQLDVHFHVLFADGTWHQGDKGVLFTPAPALHTEQVQAVLADAHKRIARQLKKFGWDDEEGWRESKVDTLRRTDPALADLLSSAVRGHQLTGEQAGQLPGKQGKLRTVEPQAHGRNCAQWAGYSLHANTRVGELARAELEKLCRYVCRPAISASRISQLPDGMVRIELKQAWRNGATAVLIPPADLILRMAAQVPLPRRPSIRYHGIFAPNAALRSQVVPAGDRPRCKRHKTHCGTPTERETSTRMTYADALKRAFSIDILTCPCGGRRVVLAAVQDPVSLERILRHVGLWADSEFSEGIEAIRGPPEDVWPVEFDPSADMPAADEDQPSDWAA